MSSVEELEKKAKVCRQILLKMVYESKSVAHVGGSLSAMDMAVAVYDKYIDFKDPNRVRFVLSKGHVVVMQYAILAELGIIPMEELTTLKKIGTRLQGHPDINKIPETEMNTGLLGQGLAVAMGMAYARKLSNNDNKIFALCGDAELHEGQIWETVQQSAHFKLDKLSGKPVAIIMKTVKGKGVSTLENNPDCHSLTIGDKDFEQAKKDLDIK